MRYHRRVAPLASRMFSNYRLLCLIALLIAAGVMSPSPARPQAPSGKNSASALENGRQILASNCAACHGIDAKGSERAPNIADSPDVQRLSDAQLSHIIENGIPGTGMPAFRSLPTSQISDLISYLRSLEGARRNARLPGNPKQGRVLFFGKAGCSQCHMFAGEGGFIASDLTDFARTHSAEQLRDAIVDANAGDKNKVRLATAVLRDGKQYVGRVRNEDNFSLQLQTLDGTFLFVAKSDLKSLEYESKPLMPDFASAFTPTELNDLISFLLSASGNGTPEHAAKDERDADE
jgi:cytochrome c oxidase cbb3-type subunit III